MVLLDVLLLSPEEVLFEGKAKSVILPGESGIFEVLPFHKRILSRLVSGNIFIDQMIFPLVRGVVKVNQNRLLIIVEKK